MVSDEGRVHKHNIALREVSYAREEVAFECILLLYRPTAKARDQPLEGRAVKLNTPNPRTPFPAKRSKALFRGSEKVTPSRRWVHDNLAPRLYRPCGECFRHSMRREIRTALATIAVGFHRSLTGGAAPSRDSTSDDTNLPRAPSSSTPSSQREASPAVLKFADPR